VEWIHLAQERDQWLALMNMVIYRSINARNFMMSLATVSFSERTLLHADR
jgi:uncharacterized membrane protein